jgi:energy-converting hydrogenase Eha subunit G
MLWAGGNVEAAARRLSRREAALWYGLAGVTYVGASLAEKFLLNWFIGPLWLVAVVGAGPALVDRVRRRGAR